jgi:hypothetical protein
MDCKEKVFGGCEELVEWFEKTVVFMEGKVKRTLIAGTFK